MAGKCMAKSLRLAQVGRCGKVANGKWSPFGSVGCRGSTRTRTVASEGADGDDPRQVWSASPSCAPLIPAPHSPMAVR